MYETIIGRQPKDKDKYGKKGTIFLGKQYVKMGQTTSLSNEIYMDVSRSHIVSVFGKRGGGKSYTMGVIAEGMASLPKEVSQNISVIILDTMGIYWTMKYPNKKDESLLKQWGLEAKALNVQIYTPIGYYKQYKEKKVTDYPFSIKPSELDAYDWCTTFGIKLTGELGVLIERIITKLKEANEDYSIEDIINELRQEPNEHLRNAAENRFNNAISWGLFSDKGTPLKDLVIGGKITVVDVSCYATIPGAREVRALVIGLIAEKLFIERMLARKNEEYKSISESMHYFSEDKKMKKLTMPMVWLIIDEAHEWLPREGSTLASKPLITILREGREPGISLILASQQPGKIHTDVITQSDIVLSHRITAKLDVDALGLLMQSYMREGLDKQFNILPKIKGSALIFDDINERIYPMQVRPRFTWHGGEAPKAVFD